MSMQSLRVSSKILLIFFLMTAAVGCDQVTKTAAKQTLAERGSRVYLGGFVRFEYAENAGAFLSLGENLPYPLRILAIGLVTTIAVVGTVLLCVRVRGMAPGKILAYTAILGGAFGNLIDRIFNQGRVVDFMVLSIGPVGTGVFNLADVFIVGGVVYLFFLTLVPVRPPRPPVFPGDPGSGSSG